MGGPGSGSVKLGDRRGPYFTQRRREEIARREAELAEQKAARSAALKVARLERQRLAGKVRRAAQKAAGIPYHPYRPEPRGASTIRARRFRARRKAAKIAAEEAVVAQHKLDLAAARKARGLERARTNAEKQAAYRARQKAKLQTYWFSPAMTFDEAEALIAMQFPTVSEVARYNSQAHLMACCEREGLNVNRFLIASPGQDGLRAAIEERAIFAQVHDEMQKAMGKPPDLVECWKAAEAIPSLICDINTRRKADDYARAIWKNGSQIFDAVEKASR